MLVTMACMAATVELNIRILRETKALMEILTRVNSKPGLENVKKILAAMDEVGLPRFVLTDIEQGYMVPVLQCLVILRANFDHNMGRESNHNHTARIRNLPEVEFSEGNDPVQGDVSTFREDSLMYGVEGKRNAVDRKHQHISHGSIGEDTALMGLMKLNGLDNVSTQALFGLVNQILVESTERKNVNLHHVASILRKLMNVIEHRVSIQAENLIREQQEQLLLNPTRSIWSMIISCSSFDDTNSRNLEVTQ